MFLVSLQVLLVKASRCVNCEKRGFSPWLKNFGEFKNSLLKKNVCKLEEASRPKLGGFKGNSARAIRILPCAVPTIS